MRLAVGDVAPAFSVKGLRGEDISLAAMRDKPTWIGFFRFASCPLCNLRVHQMIGQWQRFSDRCHYIGVFQSPPERFEGFITKHSPPFPIVSDPDLKLFTAYGVENRLGAALSLEVVKQSVEAVRAGFPLNALGAKDGAALRVPADFVVDVGGKITLTHYGANVAESVPFHIIAGHLGAP